MHRRNHLFSLAAALAVGAASSLMILDRSEPEGLVIRVNLPAYELQVWEGDRVIRSYPVTIGAPGYDTPTGRHAVDRIVWNPWWHPPDSEWARDEEETPPGPHNPMGRAKLRFAGLLYIHGTSLEDQLGEARSHGCIRMANDDVLDLARLVAGRTGIVADDELERLEADHRATREVRLETPVRVVISYRLVERRDGEVRRYEDVYGREMRPHERAMLAEANDVGGGSPLLP